MTTSINEILHNIQVKLKAPKNQFNSFGKYNFRNCEDILEAVKPLLPSGVIITMNDEIINIGDRFYIKATVTLGNDKGNITVSALAREPVSKKGMDESQVTGAASSYARKYALNGLFCIDDTKDADSGDNSTPKNKNAPQKAYKPKVTKEEKTIGEIWVEQQGKKIKSFKALQELQDYINKDSTKSHYATLDNKTKQTFNKIVAEAKVKLEEVF